MPTEFYKYAEKQADSQIDWSKIGSDMTKVLADEAKDRENRKAALEAATQETIKKIGDVKIGEDANMNEKTLTAAHDITQGLLLNNRLLKSGKLSPKDYSVFIANTKTGTEQIFKAQELFQKDAAMKKERMYSKDPAKKSQQAEWTSAAFIENFANNNWKIIQDPKTGVVNLAIMKKGKDGVLVPSNEIISASNLYRAIPQKYDYFQSASAAQTIAKHLAPVVIETIEAGKLNDRGVKMTIDDALQTTNTRGVKGNTTSMDALLASVKSYTESNPDNVMSILTEDIGTYNLVYSEEEYKKDPNHKILMVMDNTGRFQPQLTDAQKKEAEDYLITQTKAAVHQKISTDRVDLTDFSAEQNRRANSAQALDREKFEYQKLHPEGKGESSYIDEWAKYVDGAWNWKQDASKDLSAHPENEIKELNTAYGKFGYIFLVQYDEEDKKKPIAINVVSDGKTVQTFDYGKSIMNNIKKYLIADKAGKDKELEDYYKGGLLSGKKTAPANPTPANDPLGIR